MSVDLCQPIVEIVMVNIVYLMPKEENAQNSKMKMNVFKVVKMDNVYG